MNLSSMTNSLVELVVVIMPFWPKSKMLDFWVGGPVGRNAREASQVPAPLAFRSVYRDPKKVGNAS